MIRFCGRALFVPSLGRRPRSREDELVTQAEPDAGTEALALGVRVKPAQDRVDGVRARLALAEVGVESLRAALAEREAAVESSTAALAAASQPKCGRANSSSQAASRRSLLSASQS